jgi:hypothetical protein
MVLHFFEGSAAEKITADLIGWLAPGSAAIISVGSGDEQTGGTLAREYKPATLYNHPPDQVAGFFADLDMVLPGLVDARLWHPTISVEKPRNHEGGHVLAGVGRKSG